MNIMDTKSLLSIEANENKVAVEQAITPHIIKFYAQRSTETKNQIDQLGAEISQRQDKMRLLNELMCDINNATSAQNELDITQHPEMQEKMEVLRKLGVKIKPGQLKFNAVELIRLNQILELAAENWDKENKNQSQRLEVHAQHLNRLMMLLKEAHRCEKSTMKAINAGIKGN